MRSQFGLIFFLIFEQFPRLPEQNVYSPGSLKLHTEPVYSHASTPTSVFHCLYYADMRNVVEIMMTEN